MSTDRQGTKWRRNIAENFNLLNRALGRTSVTDRQTNRQTDRQANDGRATAYSERELERELTFAKNWGW